MILQPSPVVGSITKVRHRIADNEAGCAAAVGRRPNQARALPLRRRLSARTRLAAYRVCKAQALEADAAQEERLRVAEEVREEGKEIS